ncbi:uncharacterized protein LOC142317554 [Lycorma delicatula]|uniref:uncharacterized protein LOC142317554 n=1 Tax=Lycorma delicatula TaxID=130591 RepID=UPI003F50E7B7
MGDLPKSKVQATLLPFYITGVDYCGPFNVRLNKRRGSVPAKCYIALFVCFSTKALHLELVEDLTTESFIAALKRFMSRRGKPKDKYSDKERKFVGAQLEQQELCDLQKGENFKNTVSTFLAQDGVTWQFIPPKAPYFGGLWEFSVKLHLTRTMRTSVLTYTQFVTLLTQIEACINSHPLIPLSDQPNGLSALTPFSFPNW